MINKESVHEHLRGEKKAAIFHAEIERTAVTLLDHSVLEAQ